MRRFLSRRQGEMSEFGVAGWLESALAAAWRLPFLSVWGWPCLQLSHLAEIQPKRVPERDRIHFLKASYQKPTQTLVAADCIGELRYFRPLPEKLLQVRLIHSFAKANALRRRCAKPSEADDYAFSC